MPGGSIKMTGGICVPKYKRKDKGHVKRAQMAQQSQNILQDGRYKHVLSPKDAAYLEHKLYIHNWRGKFPDVKAIVLASKDPYTDNKCMAQVGAFLPVENRAALLTEAEIAIYSDPKYALEAHLQMTSYTPNEMNIEEMAGHALCALCMPLSAQDTAMLLWADMLNLFLKIDLDVLSLNYLIEYGMDDTPSDAIRNMEFLNTNDPHQWLPKS